MCRRISTSSRPKARAEAIRPRWQTEGRWGTVANLPVLEITARATAPVPARIPDSSALTPLPTELRGETSAGQPIRDRHTAPATRGRPRRDARTATTVAGKGFRPCLRDRLQSQSDRLNRRDVDQWAVRRWVAPRWGVPQQWVQTNAGTARPAARPQPAEAT